MLQNLHTHTVFCDGSSTPTEMIEGAIALGFDSLGFSAHAPTVLKTDWELRDPEGYAEEIASLKNKYADRIKVYLGTELDYYSAGTEPTLGFDYSIGSVHMAFKNDARIDFDESYEVAEKNIRELFGGNSFEYAELYYKTVADMPNVLKYDVVGHFDVLTKFSEKHPELIDTESRKYRDTAIDALREVRKKRELFEVNTGAISRGHKTRAYPDPFLLDEMKGLDCKLILTTDCHSANDIDCGYYDAVEYVKAHGFDTLYYLTDTGFVGEKI